MALRDTFQWLTGFFTVLSLSGRVPATGCHGGMLTTMLSRGFQPGPDASESESEERASAVSGSCALKRPSSRSLSNTMIVPSAYAARKSVGLEGTQRTAVQGWDVMPP
jgi:hypothetical protein